MREKKKTQPYIYISPLPSPPLPSSRNGDCFVQGLSKHSPASSEEVFRLLEIGNTRRSMSPTDQNAQSSRSHAVLQIWVTQVSFINMFIAINIVDLYMNIAIINPFFFFFVFFFLTLILFLDKIGHCKKTNSHRKAFSC